MSGYWRFSDYGIPGDETFVSSYEPHARATFIDLSKYSVPLELISESTQHVCLEPTTSAVDPGEDHEKVKAAYDIVVSSGDKAGASFGLRANVWRGGPLDIGLLHLEAERLKFTFELWLFRGDLSIEKAQYVIATRKLISTDHNAGQAMWTLYISSDGRLCFRFDKLSEVEASTEAGSINMGPTADVDVTLWNHIALVLDSSDNGDATTQEAETEVSLYINGTLRRREIIATPHFTEAELKSTVLIICPDLWGWRFTELRIWSCARNAEEIENFRENYLSLASKRKRLQYRIKGGKKLFGPLYLPPIGQSGVLTESRVENAGRDKDAPIGNVVVTLNPSKASSKQKMVLQPSPLRAKSATQLTVEITVKPRSVGSLSALDVSDAEIMNPKSLSRPHGSADAIVVSRDGEIIVAKISTDGVLQIVKYKMFAESVLLCPRKDAKIIALYSKRNLSIYNVSNKRKLVQQPMSSDLIFWKYASEATLLLLTSKVIYSWTIAVDAIPGSISRPQKLCLWDSGSG